MTPDQLGTLVDPSAPARTPYLSDLVTVAARTLARTGGGRLVFVGRSLDSVHDLLGGVLERTDGAARLERLPVSMTSAVSATEHVRWLRDLLGDLGLAPDDLARRSTPVTFVDVVYLGRTFEALHIFLRRWIDDDGHGAWPVVRRKLRYVGVTERTRTSPRTWRWQQHAAWTRELPAGAVRNVPLDWDAWSYVANDQTKLTRSHHAGRWLEPPSGPGTDEKTRQALAEALAYVDAGRSADVRRQLVAVLQREPAIAEPWLRQLVGALRG